MTLPDFIRLRLKNAERHVSRWLRKHLAKCRLTDSLDQLTLPPASGSDLRIRRLPKTCSHSSRDFYARIAMRDAILSHADLYSETEMEAAHLWCEGYSTRAIVQTLGLANSTGYRLIGPFIQQLQNTIKE